MKKYLILQWLGDFSPILKGSTDDLEKAKDLQEAFAQVYPENVYVIAQIL